MEPKFQSSFIPKSSTASSGGGGLGRGPSVKSLFSYLGVLVFSFSVLLAIGMFGYKFYLKYRIEQMGAELEAARAALEPETINELTRLSNRIISTRDLISTHVVVTPLFALLEASTALPVRFTDFRYAQTDGVPQLSMKGEARGYAALAFQADVFSQSEYFKDVAFSDLSLSDRGDVSFSLEVTVDPSLISYSRAIERLNLPQAAPATTTATTTRN
jgi:hypothetical protein